MAFNKWSKQIPANPEETDKFDMALNATSINTRQRSDLAAIQDKINKALQDIDDIYDEPTSEDPFVRDIEDEIAHMEYSPLKVKLTNFLSKYQKQEETKLAVDNERTQVLEDLADWFGMDHMGDMDMSDRGMSLITEAKFEFSKLQEVNAQLKRMSKGEDGFEEITRERIRLQSIAMESFKKAKEVAKRDVLETSKPKADGTWKHAANEIVEMMGKIRGEGKDYMLELERKVRNLVSDGEVISRKIKRLENSLEEKKQMERKWKAENGDLNKEKSTLISKIRQMKQELVKTRKSLGRHENVAPSKFESSMTDARIDRGDDSLLTAAKLESLKTEHENLKKEMEALKDNIFSLEVQLDEKDEQVCRLEHDKMELIHQMKQSSVRPDVRRLSNASAQLSTVSIALASSHSLQTDKETSKATRPPGSSESVNVLCSKCGKGLDDNDRNDRSTKPKQTSKASSPEVKEASPPPPPPTARDRSEQEEMLEKEVELLREQVTTLHNRLTAAHQTLIDSKLAQPHAMDPYPTPLPTAESQPITQCITMESNVTPSRSYTISVHVDKLAENEDRDKERSEVIPTLDNTLTVQCTEEEMAASSIAFHQGIRTTDPRAPVLQGHRINKGMQTDPKLDPLSDWTQPMKIDQGWRPPMPPAGWIDFDPTNDDYNEKYKLNKAMLKGAQPSEIKQEAEHAAKFVQSQLTRIIQGIQGFKDFIISMADSETRKMAAANNKLKSFLSQDEKSHIEKQLRRTQASSSSINMSKWLADNQFVGTSNKSHMLMNVEHDLKDITLAPEEKVKVNTSIISEKAVSMLEEAIKLLQDSFDLEYEKYENIYTTLQKRDNGYQYIFEEDDKQDSEMQVHISRSLSENDINRLVQNVEEEGKAGVVGNKLGIPNKTLIVHRSHSDILIRESVMTMGMVVDKSVNPTRQEFNIAHAMIPKKGQIKIATNNPINSMKEFNADFNASQKRKTKPAPMNHQKLKNRQKSLMQKEKSTKEPQKQTWKGQVTRIAKAGVPAAEVADDVEISFTFGDLEKNVDEYKESSRKVEHMKAIHNIHNITDGRTSDQNALPPLPIQFSKYRKTQNMTSDMKFPPINKL